MTHGNSIKTYRNTSDSSSFNVLLCRSTPLIIFFISCFISCFISSNSVANIDHFRTRLNQVIDDNWNENDVVMEINFGKEISARILSRFRLFNNEKLTRYVSLVGTSIALHSQRPELNYHFAVLDDNSLNAYSAPGGYIFITKGLLHFINDEAELAAILAHEIAHITNRHIVTEFNIKDASRENLSSLARFIGASAGTTSAVISKTVNRAMAVLFDTGFEKPDELEADHQATLLLASTGYDPTALMRLLTRIRNNTNKQMKKSVTHPSFKKRFENLSLIISQNSFDLNSFSTGKKRLELNLHKRTTKGLLYNASTDNKSQK